MTKYGAVCEALGVRYLETVSDRRGSVLLKAQEADGSIVALKGCDVTTVDDYDRHELLRREAEVLRQIGGLLGEPLFHEYCRTSAHGDWLVMEWIDGLAMKQYTDSLQDHPERVQCLIECFRGLARQLGAVHDAGYLHGDIQPAHVVIRPDSLLTPLLLDWGLGRRSDDTDTPYRGALVHYAAPEIAAGMLQQQPNIEYTRAAEIYSVGATMYFCLFGETPVQYTLDASFEDKLRAVADGELRERNLANDETLDQLGTIIDTCLAFSQEERYTSLHDLDGALAAL